MVTKLFDHLLNKFNFLNTMLSKIKKTPIFNEDVLKTLHGKFFQLVWRSLRGRRRPPRPSCYVKYDNVLLPVSV